VTAVLFLHALFIVLGGLRCRVHAITSPPSLAASLESSVVDVLKGLFQPAAQVHDRRLRMSIEELADSHLLALTCHCQVTYYVTTW
jgi:hypothetical protein